MAKGNQLLPEDWALAALRTVALEGVDNLSVERLARQLGVTKGSFYWHFKDREALVVAAAEAWEQYATVEVIAELGAVDDPLEQLRQLFAASLGDELHGPVDTALAGRGEDPVLGPIVRRVTAARVAFVESILSAMGLPPAVVARRARMIYAAYLGHFAVIRALPEDPHLVAGRSRYLDDLLHVLTAEHLQPDHRLTA